MKSKKAIMRRETLLAKVHEFLMALEVSVKTKVLKVRKGLYSHMAAQCQAQAEERRKRLFHIAIERNVLNKEKEALDEAHVEYQKMEGELN